MNLLMYLVEGVQRVVAWAGGLRGRRPVVGLGPQPGRVLVKQKGGEGSVEGALWG